MADIDLSGQSPAQTTQPSNSPTSPTPPGDTDPDILLRRDVHDGMERRGMRLILSATVLIFAILFLWQGLCFALKVGNGLLEAKSSIVSALTQNSEKVVCEPKTKCVELKQQTMKPAEKSPNVSTKGDSAMPNLSTDWLSASSLIAIVAFILGVGLTLILTLLKSAFHHPTDKNLNGQKTTDTIELATPLSELIMGVINYLKSKFSK
ncbi:hypothetical protein ACMGAV_003315 [Salmonella enterica subsp. enterica serovar Newport]|nr:hypothetical protein [Salmonella enterica]MDO3807719.1 hypothetical protein [Salmonella enterica]MDO3821933.1 hypothetical protein [Salmonella enterica]WEM86554.1 hypothetical protein P0969_00985 [Salmonella enterica subsp. enterica serovar Infantis]